MYLKSEMEINFSFEKLHGFPQFVHAIYSVFNGDPGMKSDGTKCREDRVIVVHPFPNHAVREPARIPNGVFFAAQVFDGAAFKITVAGMHRNDAMLYALEQDERILSRKNRVRWVKVHAEPRRADLIDNLNEHIHLLREFRKLPVVV